MTRFLPPPLEHELSGKQSRTLATGEPTCRRSGTPNGGALGTSRRSAASSAGSSATPQQVGNRRSIDPGPVVPILFNRSYGNFDVFAEGSLEVSRGGLLS